MSELVEHDDIGLIRALPELLARHALTAQERQLLEWLIPALETFSRPRLDPVAYTHRQANGYAFIVTSEQACQYAAEMLAKVAGAIPHSSRKT